MKTIRNYVTSLFVLIGSIAFTACNPIVKPELLPILTTNEISQISQNTATCGGNISSDNGFEVVARGVCWSLKPNPTIKDSLTKDAAGTGAFTSSVKNLLADTTYYLRAYATNKDGTGYGLQITFKTSPAVTPGLTTSEVTNITATAATSGGNITFNGGLAVTTRGVCWSISENPTILNDKTTDGSGSGIFSSNLTNLQSGKTYYVRAYATNATGTAYGTQVIFKTLSVPTVAPLAVTNRTTSTASISANITSDGGTPVTSRGICWSISSNPTISNYITSDGTGTGIFTSNISGLTEGAIYYVRAYATNIVGTAYGSQLSLLTYNNLTVADIEGNIYHTVTIGTQTWMVENLKTTKYNDGTTIPMETNSRAWAALSTPAYCWYYNVATYNNTYGALYNWYSVNSGKLAPIGWHVPTNVEWNTLTTYLGGASVAGGKLKETGTTHWSSTYIGTTNETGFSALPGGVCDNNGSFTSLGNNGIWWSSTEDVAVNAWTRSMNIGSSVVSSSEFKTMGLSVRCVRDN